MERRTFLRTGIAAGLASAGTPMAAPALLAEPRRRADGPIRLNANENPLGLAPAARRAVIEGIGETNRYPFAARGPFVEKLAAYLGTSTDTLVLGAGSTEIIQMAVQAFGRHGAKFIIADPTFEDLSDYAQPWDLELEKVPLKPDLSHDLDRMREIAESTPDDVVVYICNPNNPTGTLTSSAAVDAWIRSARSNTYFLIDEAYYEYAESHADYWSAQRWLDSHRNVVVARTFSKIFGMAGMRLGFGIAHPETAARLRSMASQNNINYLALAAGSASLDDGRLVERALASNERARSVMVGALDELGIEHIPSHTNFLMHRIQTDVPTHSARMLAEGIRVGRPFPPMLRYNRVSIGTPEEMEVFARALRTFRERGWI